MACHWLLSPMWSVTIFDTEQAAAFKRNSSAILGPAGDADRCRVVLQSTGFNVFSSPSKLRTNFSYEHEIQTGIHLA